MRLPPARSLYPSIQPGRQKTISSSPTTLALLPTRIPAFTHIITRAVTPQPPSPSDLRALYTIHTLPDIQLATKTALHAAQTAPEYLRARPVAAHTRQAFEKFLAWRARAEARAHLCLDAGCGHGNSTSHLARLHTDCDVIGIDRSYARLARRDTKTDNAMLLRAELADFWRLCWEYKVSFKYQFILYPNPYPKRRHIKRRWHGHPVFPILLALGGKIEVRSSWAGYLHEFRAVTMALLENDICSKQGDEADIRDVEQIEEESSLTNFEAKYQQVEQPIFRLRMDVGGMREGLYLQPNLQRLE